MFRFAICMRQRTRCERADANEKNAQDVDLASQTSCAFFSVCQKENGLELEKERAIVHAYLYQHINLQGNCARRLYVWF